MKRKRSETVKAKPRKEPSEDERFLREAIRLGREHMRAGDGGPFGCVIVRDGQVIARGWNTVLTANDPTGHAEVNAVRKACRLLGAFQLTGCVVYASCEPCPMCLGALYWTRPARVVFAAGRTDAARAGFDDARLYREMARTPATRRLPMRQMLRAEASAVLREWKAWDGRRAY